MTNSRHPSINAVGFGERLKTARRQCGFTQDELASKAGLSTITLSKLESGVNKPSFDVIVALCNSLEIDPNYFFGWSMEVSHQISTERRMKIQSVILNLEKLDDAWINQIITICQLAQRK
ncbi:helix-turn-helix transcriptional regulator [Brucella pituitosa]|uniref:helix-turn-helix domain-containing protein n=1 Tax=Brucella pituitosa TaxID=571256 RepID=UPI002005FB85|nr:helix-turn-helix transcriptional regulator [Brucella pituitosa]MCK4205967.1 helix-turn-helix transcriptional regulator [Brucella pituitosa]